MKTRRTFRRPPARRGGFTLVEIMIVVAIIALLAALALPALAQARTKAQRAQLVTEIKATADSFSMYAADNLHLPLESKSSSAAISQAMVPPPGMENYLPKRSHWKDGTDGTWYWVYWPGGLPGYKGFLYLYNPNLSNDDITYFDQKLDDGNPSTGALINYGGSGLVYAVE